MYASRYGLTVADFKELTIGFILNFFDIHLKLSKGINIHKEEIKYQRMKKAYPTIEKRYRSGKLDEREYKEFIHKFKVLEERYE